MRFCFWGRRLEVFQEEDDFERRQRLLRAEEKRRLWEVFFFEVLGKKLKKKKWCCAEVSVAWDGSEHWHDGSTKSSYSSWWNSYALLIVTKVQFGIVTRRSKIMQVGKRIRHASRLLKFMWTLWARSGRFYGLAKNAWATSSTPFDETYPTVYSAWGQTEGIRWTDNAPEECSSGQRL